MRAACCIVCGNAFERRLYAWNQATCSKYCGVRHRRSVKRAYWHKNKIPRCAKVPRVPSPMEQERIDIERFVVHELARAGVFNIPRTIRETAALLGINRESTWKIEQRALKKLRETHPQFAEHLQE